MRLFLHNDRSRTVPSSVRASSTEKQQSGNLTGIISEKVNSVSCKYNANVTEVWHCLHQSAHLETAISMDSGDLSTPKQNTRSSFGYGTTPASSFSFPAT
jgi:hypothetical protein